MKKKGFTLIELLAVIIILAIIALIATPIVLNVVENARKQSNKNSVYGLLDGAKLYYTESLLNGNDDINGLTNLIDKIKVSGKQPDRGSIYINEQGQTALAVVYDDVCYIKNFEDNDLTENEYIEDCELYKSIRLVQLNQGTDTSEWYVLGNENGLVTLFSVEHIGDGTYQFDDGSRNNGNNTYCQIDGGEDGCSVYTAQDQTILKPELVMCEMSETYTGTVTEDSNIKQFVDNYGSTLGLGDNLKEIRLLKTSDFDVSNIPSFFKYYLGSYWIDAGPTCPVSDVLVISTKDDVVSTSTSTATSFHYIRPVIVVPESLINYVGVVNYKF